MEALIRAFVIALLFSGVAASTHHTSSATPKTSTDSGYPVPGCLPDACPEQPSPQ